MALRPALDLELLRTLVFIAEEASFTKAAERVGRTQSAVTLQVQKLEALAGQPLVIRSKGGPVELTPQGRALVEHGRAMLKLNDEALQALAPRDVAGIVKLGVTPIYTPFYLDRAMERFRDEFPNVCIELTEGNSCQVAPHIRNGKFDLVVCTGDYEPRGWPSTEISRSPLRWITASHHTAHLQDPLPLCLVPANCPWLPSWMDNCLWRSAALRALEQAEKPYRVVASANSLEGLYAPVLAGRAITLSTGFQLPAGLRVVEEDEGLPRLPDDVLIIIKSRTPAQPYTDALSNFIRAAFSSS